MNVPSLRMPNLSIWGKRVTCSTSCATFQYRDDKHQPIRQGSGKRRWVNQGLGQSYAEINRNCQQLATHNLKKNIAARTLVISPEIDFMQAIPESRRVAVLAELTESTMEHWFDSMNLPTVEHSYVVHRGQSLDRMPDGSPKDLPAKQEFLHSHVVMAATVPGLEKDRKRYYLGKKQLPLLHSAARSEMERIWTRELGPERLQELNAELGIKAQRLSELKQVREQEKLQGQMPDQQTIQQAMHDLYEALGLDLPPARPAPAHDLNLSADRDLD